MRRAREDREVAAIIYITPSEVHLHLPPALVVNMAWTAPLEMSAQNAQTRCVT